jgi:hypothetical protein
MCAVCGVDRPSTPPPQLLKPARCLVLFVKTYRSFGSAGGVIVSAFTSAHVP